MSEKSSPAEKAVNVARAAKPATNAKAGKPGKAAKPASRAPETLKESSHVIASEMGGQMLDAAVRALATVSWGEARKWITSGKVTLDGATITDPLKKVWPGTTLQVRPRAPKAGRSQRLPSSAVLHFDGHLIVVDKPAGISTIPYEGKNDDESARSTRATPRGEVTLDAITRDWIAHRPGQSNRTGPRPELGVVHRLDKETSGLVVFTRSWMAKQALTAEFRAHTVHRRYLALVHGDLRARTVESHLIQDRGDGLRGSIESLPPAKRRGKGEGQRAITHVEPVARLVTEMGICTLVACRLETGRTHQIRIHLSEAGHPLIGERVYIRDYRPEPIPAPRMMLHAAELGFTHPVTEIPVRWQRPPPEDFQSMLERLGGARIELDGNGDGDDGDVDDQDHQDDEDDEDES